VCDKRAAPPARDARATVRGTSAHGASLGSRDPSRHVVKASRAAVRESSISLALDRVEGCVVTRARDEVAVEEPLEIRVEADVAAGGPARTRRTVAVTMRTPGEDDELAAGFLFTEGIVRDLRDIVGLRHDGATHGDDAFRNAILVDLAPGVAVDFARLNRLFPTTSACGVCGKLSAQAIRTRAAFTVRREGPHLDAALVHGLPEALRASQAVFARTGGLHAAALFDPAGRVIAYREDVGRHNAVDKLLGAALLAQNPDQARIPLDAHVLVLSGRASFELVQKAAMAAISVIVAVGAPSSLAVELAEECNITLCGFVRSGRFNIYAAPWRVRGLESKEVPS
jgi:FdhD protein